MGHFLNILLIAFLVLLNGFFVAAEFAIVKVRASRIERRAAKGGLIEKTAYRILQNMDAYLSACQVGITLASLALGWIGEPYLARQLLPLFEELGITSEKLIHGFSFAIAFAIITFLHIVVGEMAPKSVSIRMAERTTILTALPLFLFYKALYPFIEILNRSSLLLLKLIGIDAAEVRDVAQSEEELKLILAKAAKGGQLSGREAEIMENVLSLHDKMAKQIMIPRTAVVYLSTTNTFQENLNITQENQHTRYPLCEGNLDNVIGVVHIKDILAATTRGEKGLRMAKLKRETIFYPETITLDQLVREFQRTKLHMAILIDEYGGATGIVTLEDVLEELVGEIYDEFDKPVTLIRQVGQHQYLIDGLCPVKLCEEKFGILFPEFDVETIGGVVFSMAGHIPKPGHRLEFEHGTLVVESIDRQRIAKVRLLLDKHKPEVSV